MLNRGFLAVILSTVAWAADQHVSVPAGGQAETRILLSPSELRTEQVLLVVANPRQIQVTVIGPDGRRWTQANSREGSLVEMLAPPTIRSGQLTQRWGFFAPHG
jgi:hypothetical protein